MRLFLILLIIPFNFVCAQKTDYKLRSIQVFENIKSSDFSKVTMLFDSNMSKRIDTTRLRKNWEGVISFAGQYKSTIKVEEDKKDSALTVIQYLQFEKKKINLKLVYNKQDKIKLLTFLPGETHEAYKLPDYDKPDLYTEKDLSIQNTIYRMPGILTTPKKPGRFPVVILVHGAGANDKDETVGPLKIFKDLAIGLASKGVAVYRYEKRTKVYRGRMMRNLHVTVNEETIEDVVAAVALLKKDSLVDSTAIYICGHSLGGMLLPRIAERTTGVKGLIYLAANARHIEDILYEQTAYLLTLDTTGKDRAMVLDSVKKEVQSIKALKETDSDSLYYLRIPAPYWKDLNKYDPLKTAEGLKEPMLFIHGGRDFQVTEEDFNLWKTRLKNKNATFKLYPELNHFFVKGVGKSIPSEYDKVGNVDISVINDISNWVLPAKK